MIPLRFRRAVRRLWLPIAISVWPLCRLWYRAWGLRLDGNPGDSVWYFAFGANMHDSALRERRGIEPVEWRAACIQNYRLRFNLDGRPKGRAAPANIAYAAGKEVWGVAYRITRRDLVRLDATEGIPGRRYRHLWIDALDRDGNSVAIVTYMAKGNDQDGKPSLRYITLLRDGAKAHGLPDHWIDFLKAVEPAE